jgi:predicted ATPase
MPLSPGARLGPYEIVSLLGVGGMGEVYRARDTRLDRAVAIKLLPEQLAQRADRRERLEREGRAISRLSHPNICTLHDIGQQDGSFFLVLEFVEGKTLRQLLAYGILPIGKLISIAVQIADGLAQAHEAGIIHRDLKPENLMVCADAVKILDFGLAKLSLEGEDPLDNSITLDSPTQPGTILGTVEYMSPEQAQGEALDFRSDQFSFGSVLYEMATGKRAFRRKAPTQSLLAIIQEELPPISSLNPEVPPPLSWVVERCLAKEPEKRYFATRDLVRDLVAIRDRLTDLQHQWSPNRGNLPTPSSEIIGREKELAAAKTLLLRQDVRLLTISGPGGIGKSRLALELARVTAENFSAGVYFVPLAPVNDPNLIALLISQTLGVRETAGQSHLQTLKNYLQNSVSAPMLLLIDNFEHLIEAAPMLSALLAHGSTLKLVVTTRQALHVSQEHEFSVPPLSLPEAKSVSSSLEALSQYPAVALFIQRAAAVRPDFTLTKDNASAVVEICSRLDGLPLAIELAAARAKLLSPAAIRTRLVNRLQLLTAGARDLPVRQQTLRQAIDWSYDLLNESEQKLFRRLSVFVGGCTLEAVESVCNTKNDLGIDIFDGMASMVDKNLVGQLEQANAEPRFVMLETIREYAREKLAARGEERTTKRAHAAYCLVLAEEGTAEDSAQNRNEWLDRLELEHSDFRVALEWLIETGDADWGLRLGLALFPFWEAREHFAEGRNLLEKLLKLPAAAPPTNARLCALLAAGVLAGSQRDYVSSDSLFQENLRISREQGDKRSVAVSLNALAINARDCGELPASRALFEESLLLWRELQDAPALARALSNLANIVKMQNDFAHARALYEECLSIFRELADAPGMAWALNHQGDVAREQGDSVAARSLYEQSLATFRQLGDRWAIARSLADLGYLAREQGAYHEADSLFRESIRLFQQLEHKRGIARLLESFACSAAAQSEPARALRLAGAAAALRQTIGSPLTAVEQAQLERGLEKAHRAMAGTIGRTAWLEGWVMPVEQAIEDVLRPAPNPGSSQLAGGQAS